MLLTITLHCMWLTMSAAVSGCGDMTSDEVNRACSEIKEESQRTKLEIHHADFSLFDNIMNSMEELKALPGELKESLILHVERRSLMVAGVVVAIGAAIMLLGCLWIHWCHTEHGEYVPLTPAKEEHEKKQQQHHHQKLRDHSHKAGTHLDNGVKKLTHRRVHVVTKSH